MQGELLAELPAAAAVAYAGLLGLLIGSFLNVVIHRIPLGESLLRPGSRCPGCQRPIRPWENVPVLSWLLLRGRCAGCGRWISLRYPAVELLTGMLFAALVYRTGVGWMTPVWLAWGAALVTAAAIDFDHRFIPDEVTLGGLAVALVCVPLAHWLEGQLWVEALLRSALGALLGGGMLWIVGFVHARLSVAMGRSFEHWPGEGEEIPKPASLDYWTWFPGMGFGDVKLLAMIGAVVGPWGVMETVVVASLLGLVMALAWAAGTRRFDAPFGFGPAIAAAALLGVLVPWRPF